MCVIPRPQSTGGDLDDDDDDDDDDDGYDRQTRENGKPFALTPIFFDD